jgi:large subunit ribosomal protein L10
MKLTRKQEIVAELHKKFASAQIMVLTDYKGLDVSTLNLLRRKLKEAGAEYRVVKNTLLVRASEGTDAALIKESFTGPSAIMFSDGEPVAPAKVLTEFAKENKKFEVQVGLLGGKVLSDADIKAIADLPSKEVLIAQALGALNAVPTGIVRVLNAIPQQFMNVLQAIKEQKEAA